MSNTFIVEEGTVGDFSSFFGQGASSHLHHRIYIFSLNNLLVLLSFELLSLSCKASLWISCQKFIIFFLLKFNLKKNYVKKFFEKKLIEFLGKTWRYYLSKGKTFRGDEYWFPLSAECRVCALRKIRKISSTNLIRSS